MQTQGNCSKILLSVFSIFTCIAQVLTLNFLPIVNIICLHDIVVVPVLKPGILAWFPISFFIKGYQTAFSELMFAGKKEHDPFHVISEPKEFLAKQLYKLSLTCPGKVSRSFCCFSMFLNLMKRIWMKLYLHVSSLLYLHNPVLSLIFPESALKHLQ